MPYTVTVTLEYIDPGDTVTIQQDGNTATGIVEETAKPRKRAIRAFGVLIPFAVLRNGEWEQILPIIEHQQPLIPA